MYNEAIFGLTAAVSFVATGLFAWLSFKSRSISKLLWSISFLILGLSTALISAYGLSVLSIPLVAPLDTLIPGLLAAGLVMSRRKMLGVYFLLYVFLVFSALFALAAEFGALAAPYVMLVHFPSGLIIFLLPIYLVIKRRVAFEGLLVGAGGLLIGIAGIALATLSTNFQILPASLVLEIIAPVFLAMTILFTLGLLATPTWGFPKAARVKTVSVQTSGKN